jgi:DNA replication protein DnaC
MTNNPQTQDLTITQSTFADAILDRLVHNAYRVELDGESKRPKLLTENSGLAAAKQGWPDTPV